MRASARARGRRVWRRMVLETGEDTEELLWGVVVRRVAEAGCGCRLRMRAFGCLDQECVLPGACSGCVLLGACFRVRASGCLNPLA
jgi:hypothetical protein